MLTRFSRLKYRALSPFKPRILGQCCRENVIDNEHILVNIIAKRYSSNETEIKDLVKNKIINNKHLGNDPLTQIKKNDIHTPNVNNDIHAPHVNSTRQEKRKYNIPQPRLKKLSFQERRMIVKEIESIAFDVKDKKTERIQQLRHYREVLLKTYDAKALNYALKTEFDNNFSEKYNSMGLINGGMLIYIAYFPEMLFLRKLYHLATTHVEHTAVDSIMAIVKIYLQDLGLTFLPKEAELFTKYLKKDMSDEEFIMFFQYCISNEIKILKLNNTMFFIDRILARKDQNEKTTMFKSILTFAGTENEFKKMSLDQKLSRLLPDKYFFTIVDYLSANNHDNKLSKMMHLMNEAVFDLFVKKYQSKAKPKLLDISNYLRCFYLSSLTKNMVIDDGVANEQSKSIEYFAKSLHSVKTNLHLYGNDELEVFFIRNFEMLAEMLDHCGKLEYFQSLVMQILSKYSILVMGVDQTVKSQNSLVLHYRRFFWRIFFKNFLKLTENDFKALFQLLEKLHPSIIVTLLKFDLLKDFDYKPSVEFLNKIESFISNATEEEINSWNVDQGGLADESFLADFYQFLIIPSSMDSQTFRKKYYEYCEKRDQLFRTPDKDLVSEVFIKYSTQKFNSYWMAFFILRTHLMKPSSNRNMGIDNPILKFIRNDGFISLQNPIDVRKKLFERYTNNFVRVYRACGVPLDGFIVIEFLLKAHKLGLSRDVIKWYLFGYHRFNTMKNNEPWASFLNLKIFKFICDNDLPILKENVNLSNFAKYYSQHKIENRIDMNTTNDLKLGKPDKSCDFSFKNSLSKDKDLIASEPLEKTETEIFTNKPVQPFGQENIIKEDPLTHNKKINDDLKKIDFGFFKAEHYTATEKEYFDVEEITLDEFLENNAEDETRAEAQKGVVSSGKFDDDVASCLELFSLMVENRFSFKNKE